MAKAYSFTYTTPEGKVAAEADTGAALQRIITAKVIRVLDVQNLVWSMSPERAAKEALKIYRVTTGHSRARRSRTSLAAAGVEEDVIKCYLQGMTIVQIVEWLRDNRGVTCSMSSVGRFCAAMRKLNILPLQEVAHTK